jgi:hypothetical protein
MAIKKITDPRDLIVSHLEEIKRPLRWLSTITDIPYGSIYSIFVQKTMELTQERLDKINAGLETDFTLPE